jgi:para-nitrobenzyl esterase
MRRLLLALASLLLLLAAALCSAQRPPPTVTVRTAQGLVRGGVRGGGVGSVAEFKGLPFALPPTGAAGRFRPPRTPAQSWAGVRDATQFRPNCLSDGFGRDPTGIGDEDCLYLNVYAPASRPAKPLPVLFWIHGGGFQGGGANDTILNGTWAVALSRNELIVVTSNYRLNIWGWLASDHLRSRDAAQNSTGNYGIQDNRAAMLWTRENIAAFGGDPGRVLIVGQSAGSALVSCHLTRRQSWPYFSAAGLESGAYYTGPTVSGAEPQFQALLKHLDCPPAARGSSTEAVDCLVNTPTSQIVAANEYFQKHSPSTGVGGASPAAAVAALLYRLAGWLAGWLAG